MFMLKNYHMDLRYGFERMYFLVHFTMLGPSFLLHIVPMGTNYLQQFVPLFTFVVSFYVIIVIQQIFMKKEYKKQRTTFLYIYKT
jgi:hypothetical protein